VRVSTPLCNGSVQVMHAAVVLQGRPLTLTSVRFRVVPWVRLVRHETSLDKGIYANTCIPEI